MFVDASSSHSRADAEKPSGSFALTFAWSDDVFLLVHVVFVAFDVAAPTFQGGGGFEHVPQGFGAGLTAGGEMVKRGDELVALVADVSRLLPDRQRLHRELGLFFALPFVGVKNLYI